MECTFKIKSKPEKKPKTYRLPTQITNKLEELSKNNNTSEISIVTQLLAYALKELGELPEDTDF